MSASLSSVLSACTFLVADGSMSPRSVFCIFNCGCCQLRPGFHRGFHDTGLGIDRPGWYRWCSVCIWRWKFVALIDLIHQIPCPVVAKAPLFDFLVHKGCFNFIQADAMVIIWKELLLGRCILQWDAIPKLLEELGYDEGDEDVAWFGDYNFIHVLWKFALSSRLPRGICYVHPFPRNVLDLVIMMLGPPLNQPRCPLSW